MNGPVVIASDLTREFKTVRAVDRVTFEIPSGVIFGFLGSNGAGKTTTIRLFLGLLAPSSGHAEVLGFEIGRASCRERV